MSASQEGLCSMGESGGLLVGQSVGRLVWFGLAWLVGY
jgi:hypothetical protein